MAEFDAVRDRLKAILQRHRGGLAVTRDGPGGVTIEMPGYEGRPRGYVAGGPDRAGDRGA